MRTRRLAVTAFALGLLVLTGCLIRSYMRTRSFAEQENQDVARSVQRASTALEQLFADLQGKAADWQKSEDRYRFMAEHDSAFLTATIDIDIALVLDADGKPEYSKSVKRFDALPPPEPARVLASLDLAKSLKAGRQRESGYRDIVTLAECPMLVVVQPRLTSGRSGSGLRQLVLGRYLSPAALQRIAATTRLECGAWAFGARDLPADVTRAITAIGAHSELVRPINDGSVAGYAVMYDTWRRPALVLRVTRPRAASGEAERRRASLMLAAELILFGIGSLALVVPGLISPTSRAKSTQPFECRAMPAATIPAPPLVDVTPAPQPAVETDAAPAIEEESGAPAEAGEPAAPAIADDSHPAHDSLTNLPNRALFNYLLREAHGKAQNSNESIAVVLIDVDNLNNIRVGLGPAAADEVLVAVADRLSNQAGPGDTVARFGGSEFTVLINDATAGDGAVGTTERMVRALDAPIPTGGQGIFAVTSVGMAIQDAASDSPTALLRNAATAQAVAKASDSPGVVLFDPTMTDRVQKAVEIEEELRFAIERDELFLMYHPLVHMASGRVCGAEALLRWNHPKLGLVLPGQFVPVAEETGLILPIGYWTLQTACRQLMIWQQSHPEFGAFTMTINLSGIELQSPGIAASVREVIRRTGIDPAQIKLAIPESAVLGDVEATVDRLQALRPLGVRLAIRDFGRGHFSFAALKALSLNAVRIDRAFVQRLRNHESATAQIVKTITSVAKGLHMEVTAQGVETEAQAAQLRDLGCDVGQGYLYARPLTPEGIEQFVTRGAHDQARRQSDPTVYHVPPIPLRAEE